jgi:hypothetical protein
MGRTRLKFVLVAVAFSALGWTFGRAQSRQPDFELVITAPGGPTNTTPEGMTKVECVRGCELIWAERGLNPNSRGSSTFRFGCGAEWCASGRIGGWIITP